MGITINQIAEICGVSRGTVDRALNNKGNVRPAVSEHIKQVAAEHRYQPNLAGRALARAHSPINIGVVMHSASTPFIQLLIHYINVYAEEIAIQGFKVHIRAVELFDYKEMINQIDLLVSEQKIQGLILMPLALKDLSTKVNELSDVLKIPVITMNADLPKSHRLCYVGQDNVASGRAAAGLMCMLLQKENPKILPITDNFSGHLAYNERLFGFTQEMLFHQTNAFMLPTASYSDDPAHTVEFVENIIKEHPDLDGIYMSSNGHVNIGNVIHKLNLQSKIKLIVHDEIAENLQLARLGVNDFVLGQEVRTQASLPLKLLVDLIVSGKKPEREIFNTAIEVRFDYNITQQDIDNFTI